MNKQLVLQSELGNVMENLDEFIITKSSEGINYCNKNGFQILLSIQKIIKKIDEI
jgi:hypothetical protein